MALKKKDREILKILQNNARLSVRNIAQQINMPPTTIHSRIKKMEREGIIKGYTVILDEKKLGILAKAFIFVSLSSKYKKANLNFIASKIAKYPQVQEVCVISGDWDLIIKLKSNNTDDIGNFALNLRKINGVEKTFTSIVFDTYKELPNVMLV
jgi:Lrp/AsnC family transcriptional regulator, leucine-responsive regulatory protein